MVMQTVNIVLMVFTVVDILTMLHTLGMQMENNIYLSKKIRRMPGELEECSQKKWLSVYILRISTFFLLCRLLLVVMEA